MTEVRTVVPSVKARASRALGAAAALVAVAPAAFAQSAPTTPDVSAGVTFIESLLTPIGLLGAAFLIVSIAIKGWKIMRSV